MASDRELLREQWRTAASTLGIEFVAPFHLTANDGSAYEFAALLPQFGGVRGMLIDVEHRPEAFEAGIRAGFGCTSVPPQASHLPFDTSSYVECLLDWGRRLRLKKPSTTRPSR